MAHEQGLLEIEDDGIDVVVQGDDNGATFEEESEHLGHVDIDLEADVSKLSGDSLTSIHISRYLLLFVLIWKSVYKVTDNAVNVLLKFLNFLFLKINNSMPRIKVPMSLSSAKRSVGINDNFYQYIVCPKCHSLYDMNDCIKNSDFGTGVESSKCRFIQFPDHPQRSFRQPCNEKLLKEVKLASGGKKLVPIKTYCYRSILNDLTERFKNPGFLALINSWRQYISVDGVLTDIYDGRLWKELQVSTGGLEGNTIGFMLNVDWFNPFKHGTYSMGAIYLSILNLPRQIRFKEQNTILVGLIPGPKEPKLVLNAYLTPLVQDLLKLDDGFWFSSPDALGKRVFIKGRLIAICCDIPASRKVCGFVGHSALKACNKCLKDFKRIGDRTNYSGFDLDSWPCRTSADHRINATQYLQCKTKTERKQFENEHGLRFSVLLDLPYFDIIATCAIDPMHNLFLGTSKHVMEVWQKANIISAKDLGVIQDKVNSMIPPSDVGRIPAKISSNFNDFTADEWKNWTLIYSVYSLNDILPPQHMAMWELYVRACSILCTRVITAENLTLAHSLLLQFNSLFEQILGPEHCSINMHLHCHLAESVLNFGPIYSFWCFSYERYNGILGSYSTNNHSINVQVMRKFTLHQSLEKYVLDCDFISDEYKENIMSNLGSHFSNASTWLLCTVSDLLVCSSDRLVEETIYPLFRLGIFGAVQVIYETTECRQIYVAMV